MTDASITFDLTTQQGAADAAAHIISNLGERLVFTINGRPCRVRPTSVAIWQDVRGYPLSVTHKSLPHEFSGVITIAEDTEPAEVPVSLRRSLDLIRRPTRRNEETPR